MKLRAYVAGPYSTAYFIRSLVHERLRQINVEPTSSWAELATGPEDFARFSPAAIRNAAAKNDADLRGSHVLLVVDLAGTGRETYAELRLALEWNKACVFLGRPALSAFRSGVVRVANLDGAIDILARMRLALEQGYRGQLLAQFAEDR